MAHFAEIDEKNVVRQIIVVNNNELLDDKGKESESKGVEFCIAHFGGRWVQTSYNATFRGKFAAVGYTYDESLDEFVAPILERQ
jgi:hypothetical protein